MKVQLIRGGLDMQLALTQRDQIFRHYQINKFKREGLVPTVTMTVQIDVTHMLELKDITNADGIFSSHITITHIVSKAVADTLTYYPLLFCFFNGKEIIENQELAINIPVDVENHVEYIVLHNPDSKNLSTIAQEFATELNRIRSGNGTFFNVIKQWKQKPSNSNLDPIEFLRHHHGNFIISNFGSFHVDNGSLALTQPIISGLCVGSVKPSVYRQSNENVRAMILPLTISFDHRPVDGAYVGRFLNDVRKLLETPEKLFDYN
jgi:pyruvate dehydrogenase E2 component (dihydrolipoamide acetyltransferase)